MTYDQKVALLEKRLLETADLLYELSLGDEGYFMRDQIVPDPLIAKLDSTARVVRTHMLKRGPDARD